MKDFKITKKDKNKTNDPFREQYMPKETIFQAFGNITGRRIADIALTTGYYTKDLQKLVGQMGKVYSIEVRSNVNELVTYKTKDQKNVINTLSSEKSIPLDPAIIDIAISINSFHEFDDKEIILEEIRRILKPRARFFIVDFSPEASPPPGPPKDRRILKEDVILILEDLGFRYLKSFEVGIYHYGLIFERKV